MDKQQLMALPEKQRRLILGQEAIEYGYGGVTAISKKYSISRVTVTRGRDEYKAGIKFNRGDRSRKKGGGRKSITNKYPEIEERIVELVERENSVYGDPMSKKKWTALSERKISKFLAQDHDIKVSHKTVGRILKKKSLVVNKIKK